MGGRAIAAQTAVVLLVLALLEVSVRAGWVSALFVATPSTALGTLLRQVAEGPLGHAVLLTVLETAATFAAAGTAGIALGYLLWRIPLAGAAYEPFLAALFASPVILLYPIFLVLFGRTPLAIGAQAFLFGVVPVILYTRQGFAQVRPVLWRVGRSLALPERQIFRSILLPAAAPTIFTGLRLGLTYILIGTVAMEYIVQIGGIGQWIAYAYLRLRTDDLYAGLFAVLLLCTLFLALTYQVERRVRRWQA